MTDLARDLAAILCGLCPACDSAVATPCPECGRCPRCGHPERCRYARATAPQREVVAVLMPFNAVRDLGGDEQC